MTANELILGNVIPQEGKAWVLNPLSTYTKILISSASAVFEMTYWFLKRHTSLETVPLHLGADQMIPLSPYYLLGMLPLLFNFCLRVQSGIIV